VWQGAPAGEHRSPPATWRTEYGTLVATRVGSVDGRQWLETRTRVQLTPGLARRQSQHVTVGIDLTVRAVLGMPVPSGRPEVAA
jgi:hypothetical protein